MARAPRKNARVILLLFLLGSVFLRSNAHNKYCVGLRRDWYGAEIIARRLLYTYNRVSMFIAACRLKQLSKEYFSEKKAAHGFQVFYVVAIALDVFFIFCYIGISV